MFIYFIMSIALKVKQTTERTNDDLRYFVERSLMTQCQLHLQSLLLYLS